MKAKELRIGNYIQDGKTNVLEINGLHNETIYSVYPLNASPKFETTTDSTDIKPIPLTEEWLLKFGFEKDHYKKEVYYTLSNDDDYYIEEDKNIKLWDFNMKEGIGFYLRSFKRVHQLQNLYFALTGEELKIKQTETA